MRAWFLLFRPWSYTATLVPFLAAASMFATHRDANWLHWAGGLLAGLFFQATVNLLNTWGDERSGVDDVPGAIRTTPQVHEGLVSMRAVFAAAAICAFLAGTLGVALCFYRHGGVWRFNWELLVAGFIGFLGATNYSTGVKFKYRGLGVPFVSFLMGPLEIFVALTLLAPGIGTEAFAMFSGLADKGHGESVALLLAVESLAMYLVWTLPVAALVGVIMHGNDMRDIPTDRAAGIVTLASRLGPRGALRYYRICHVIPYVVWTLQAIVLQAVSCFRLHGLKPSLLVLLLPYLCLPLTVKTLRTATRVYLGNPANPEWRGLERASGGIHFAFGVLYAGVFALLPFIHL